MRGNRQLNGDLETLYRRRFEAFLYTATAYLGDAEAARDIVHDAFAQALRRQRTYRPTGSLEAWVWKILLNLARDRLRARRRAPITSGKVDARVPSLDTEDADSVRQGVLALPERQRLAVFLRYYADLDYETIARLLGISAGTVAASLNSAHSSLHRQLMEATK